MPHLPLEAKENAVKWAHRIPERIVARWYGVHPDTVRRWKDTIRLSDATRPELPSRRMQTKEVECIRGEDGVTWRRT